VDSVETGDEITIDFEAGTVHTPGSDYGFPPLASSVMEILNAGGLIPHVQRKLGLE
jgi:3-isopropylmalate dehydratase small subunit